MRSFLLPVGTVIWMIVWATAPATASDTYGSYGATSDSQDLSLEQIFRLTHAPDVTAALIQLKEETPAAFQDFTLVFASQSLQQASYEHPRAIVSGRSARTVLTFNNRPSHRGYSVLESFSVTPQAQAHDPYLTFVELKPEAEANPGKCYRCHYSDPRPIWAPYDFWEGVYGSADDALINFRDAEEPDRLRRSVEGNVGIFADSKEEFFADLQQEHDAYQRFKLLRDADPSSRYHVLTHRGATPDAPYIEAPRSGGYPLRPNVTLTDRLATLNAKRMVHLLTRDQTCSEPRAVLVLGAMLGCDMHPASSWRGAEYHWQSETYVDDFARATETYLQRFEHLKDRGPWVRSHPNRLSRDVVLLAGLGLEKEDWNLQQRPDQWQYFAGSRFMKLYFVEELYRTTRARRLPELPATGYIMKALAPDYDFAGYQELIALDDTDGIEPYRHASQQKHLACKVLRQNLQNPASWAPEPCDLTRKSADTPAVVRMCNSCHRDGTEGAPQIDLSLPAQLTTTQVQAILNRTHPNAPSRMRMPPNRPLTHRERAQLQRFVRKAR